MLWLRSLRCVSYIVIMIEHSIAFDEYISDNYDYVNLIYKYAYLILNYEKKHTSYNILLSNI